jgi:hypothetical protein
MSARVAGVDDDRPQDADRTGTYILIVVVEILTVGGLYLFGRYFSS